MRGEIDKKIYIVEYKSRIILDENETISIIEKAKESLEKNADLHEVDIMKIYYLIGVGYFRMTKYDESIEYLNKSIELAKKLFEEYYLAKAYGWKALDCLNTFRSAEYEENFNIAENKLRYLKQYDDLACLCSRIACNLYRGERSKDEMQIIINKAEEYLKKFESNLSSECYLAIGQMYSLKLNDFNNAIDHYYKSLELARKYNSTHIEVMVLYHLGVGYLQLNLKNESAQIFFEILKDKKFGEYYIVQSAVAVELIRILVEKKIYLEEIDLYIDKAKECIGKIGISKREQFEMVLDVIIITSNITIKKHEASQYINRLKEIKDRYYEYGNKFTFSNFDYDIEELYGEIYYSLGEYEKALKHHKLLLNLSKKYEVTFLIKSYNYLAKDYEAINDYEKAYFYMKEANKALIEIEHRDLVQKYVGVYKNYEKLREQEKEKEDFFANLSHELKTPINIIYSSMQLLKLFKDEDGFKDMFIKYERSIRQNCLRLSRLVNNIIDISKIESGALYANFVNYDIVKLAKDVATSVLSYVEINKVKLIFNSDIDEFMIICDPNFIERVLLNLLSNAIKFSKEEGNIYLNVYLKDKYVVLEVKDEGIGIPANMQKQVFERFVQLDKSLSRRKEGSGIGLSIVKMLVEMHNGYIEIESEEMKGSTFKVFLPYKGLGNITKFRTCNNYNVNIERVSAELSDIYELI